MRNRIPHNFRNSILLILLCDVFESKQTSLDDGGSFSENFEVIIERCLMRFRTFCDLNFSFNVMFYIGVLTKYLLCFSFNHNTMTLSGGNCVIAETGTTISIIMLFEHAARKSYLINSSCKCLPSFCTYLYLVKVNTRARVS